LTRSGEVVVWILEVPKSVFKGGKLDEKSLKSWLKEVHEEAYKQFTGEGGQINWNEEVKLGVKLFERLRGTGRGMGIPAPCWMWFLIYLVSVFHGLSCRRR
jgi:hypothetical protein